MLPARAVSAIQMTSHAVRTMGHSPEATERSRTPTETLDEATLSTPPSRCQGGYTRRMKNDRALRAELVRFLRTEGAHLSLADAVKNFPVKDMNRRPPHVPDTFWHLIEHIRIGQWDILDFIRNPDYQKLRFLHDYWPARNAKATKKEPHRARTRYG